MNRADYKNYKFSYSLYAFIFALLIWLLLRINGIIDNNYSFSLFGFFEYYKVNPYNLVFDFIIFGSSVFLGYLLGRNLDNKQNELTSELNFEKEKNKRVFHFTEKLRQRSFAEEDILIRNDELLIGRRY